MRRRSSRMPLLPLLLFICALSSPWAHQVAASEAPDVEWSDTSRDVYVNGELEPAATVLTAAASETTGPRMAILSELAHRAFIVDRDQMEVYELPLAHFQLTATGASSPAVAEALSTGRATRVRDRRSSHFLASTGGHTLLISPHQGPSGEIELDDLYAATPTWRRRADAYQPDAQAVMALAAQEEPVEVIVAFGTWCGDSRNYVPKLLRSLEAAANPNLRLELVAIERGFGKPAEHILGQRLTNVPTVIVRQGEAEIGRIVETPATATVEADLAAILNRAPEPHLGRWNREAEIANGRYLYHDDAGRELGDETWELFATEGGGRLLHSRVTRDGKTLEIWHRRDAKGASEFVELTRSHGQEHSRTRIWIDDQELRAVTRGNVTGIVEQTLAVPPGTSFALPCAAEAGYDWLRHGRRSGDSVFTAFEIAADLPTGGKLVEVRATPNGQETLTAGPRQVAALRLAASSGDVTSWWWLDDELGMPIRGAIGDASQVTLEELAVRQ